jgi:leucyl aminopeptidase
MHIVAGQNLTVDTLIYPLFEEDLAHHLAYEVRPHMKQRGQTTWFFGQRGEQHLLVVGMGKRTDFQAERLREAAGNAGRAAEREGVRSVGVKLEALQVLAANEFTMESLITAWVEGWLLGTYVFDTYKSKKTVRTIEQMRLHVDASSEIDEAIMTGRIRAKGTIFTREMVNEPANQLNPDSFVERIQAHYAEGKAQLRVYRGEQLEQLQMRGLITVGQGSPHPPAFVELRYCTDPSLPLTALVGKGVTFDMGGMNVKSGKDISDARFDMGGAAAVLGAMDILMELEVKTNVVALLVIAENVPDGAAYLPSDIIQYPNGISVQVGNTDGEGRLMLADALLYAHRIGAQEVVELATLTGTIGVALGLGIAGIFGNEGLSHALIRAGEKSGDRLWPLPIIDEYETFLKSDYADLNNNSSSPYGGAIMAALFLRHFVDPSQRWVHIDMANTVQAHAACGHYIPGATGYGARLLTDYIMERSASYMQGGM